MLSGLGGDELLGGYSSFYKIPRAINLYQYLKYMPKFSEITEYIGIKLNNYLLMNPKYVSMFKYSKSFSSSYFIYRALFLPWELKEILDPDLIEDGIRSLNLMKNGRKNKYIILREITTSLEIFHEINFKRF